MSLILIDEPGKGQRWVRQDSMIGRVKVKQVKNGSVIMDDNGRTYELEPTRTAKRSLIKGEKGIEGVSSSVINTSASTGQPTPTRTSSRTRTSRRSRTPSRRTPNPAIKSQPIQHQQISDEDVAKIDELMKELEGIEDVAQMEKKTIEMMDLLEQSIMVSEDEAAQIEAMGGQPEDVNTENKDN